jgi:tripartite-type tricarboxylate transporter receptor subunit TctC
MLKRLTRRSLALVLSLACVGVMAQSDYPNKPIRIVVAWPPASGIDTVMRHLTEALRVELGQPIIVDNRAGAAGAIGAAAVANAAPDGYTLLFNSAAMNMLSAMQTPTQYKMPESFTPIANVFSSPMVLVADPALDIKLPQNLADLAKERKGNLFYATSGYGAPSHFVAELFRARAGIDATAIHMKGSPQAMLEQMAGRVAFHFAITSTALQPARDGKVKAVAVTSKVRLAAAPEIPTMQELGFKDFNASYWNGLFGPQGMPQPIADRLALAVNRVMSRPDIQAKLQATANELDTSSNPQKFASMIKDDLGVWQDVVRFAKIKPRHIVAAVGRSLDAVNGCQVDDAAPIARFHAGHQAVHEVVGRTQIHRQRIRPFVR